MKKSTVVMMLAASAGFASCTSQAPQANLKSDMDTLSYMVGVANSQGLRDYALQSIGIDSAHIADFIKGIEQGTKEVDAKQKAYLAGMQIGQSISDEKRLDMLNQRLFSGDSTLAVDKENFLAGFIASVRETALASIDSANFYVNDKVKALREKKLLAQYADYKKQNEDFLATNKTKEGIKTTESGLQYRIVKEGKGEVPTASSRVKVHYKGTLIDGTEFDSSYKGKEPIVFAANQVIKGWTEALTMMPVGSKWELFIPQELAYGSEPPTSKIKPYSTLIFEVELIGIEK